MLKKAMSEGNLSNVTTSLTSGISSLTTKAVIAALKTEEGKAAVIGLVKEGLSGAVGAAGEMAKKAKEEAERMAADMAKIAKDQAKGTIKPVLDAFRDGLSQIPMGGGSAIRRVLEQAMTAAGL
jgi:hypothetical protein